MTDDLGQHLDAADVDGDPYDRPPARKLRGPAHAHLDAPCTDACYEPAAPPDPEFAAVIDQARAVYRPGVPDDELPSGTQDMDGRQVTVGEIASLARAFTEAIVALPKWAVPPPMPAGAADAALVLYLAACQQCGMDDAATGGDSLHMAVPFGRETDRDGWAQAHARDRRHVVTLVEQHPATGSTITGKVHPGEPEPAEPVRAAVPYEPPLIAFVVRSGKQPNLLCTIPERAGAAWLLTAAHATLLGRGSLGIPQPHRALYVGRLSTVTRPGDVRPEYEIRIDGLLGGTDGMFGRPIGMVMTIASHLSPGEVEDTCESIISRVHSVPRNLFSVVVMADPGPGTEPDEQADALLREQRLAARADHRAGGGQPVDALVEFVDREVRGPVAEVADVGPDR